MSAIEIVNRYGAAVVAGDMCALAKTLSAHAVWHQPGASVLSGDKHGPAEILAHLGRFMELSGGTFRLEPGPASESGCLVSMPVHFTARRAGRSDLDQRGVDVFLVDGGRIIEIWLISEDQVAEDLFWS